MRATGSGSVGAAERVEQLADHVAHERRAAPPPWCRTRCRPCRGRPPPPRRCRPCASRRSPARSNTVRAAAIRPSRVRRPRSVSGAAPARCVRGQRHGTLRGRPAGRRHVDEPGAQVLARGPWPAGRGASVGDPAAEQPVHHDVDRAQVGKRCTSTREPGAPRAAARRHGTVRRSASVHEPGVARARRQLAGRLAAPASRPPDVGHRRPCRRERAPTARTARAASRADERPPGDAGVEQAAAADARPSARPGRPARPPCRRAPVRDPGPARRFAPSSVTVCTTSVGRDGRGPVDAVRRPLGRGARSGTCRGRRRAPTRQRAR